jgi:hypothetical protein
VPSDAHLRHKNAGIDPAPRRDGPTWAQFLRSQAEAQPRSNCWAERWIRGARYDCTDNVLLFGAAHEDHFNGHRPHQARDQTPPDADIAEVIPIEGRIRRRQVPPPPSTSITEPPDQLGEPAGQCPYTLVLAR